MINPFRRKKEKEFRFAVVEHPNGDVTFAGFGQTRRTNRLPVRLLPVSEIKRILEWLESIQRAIEIRIAATRGALLKELYRRAEFAPSEVPRIEEL